MRCVFEIFNSYVILCPFPSGQAGLRACIDNLRANETKSFDLFSQYATCASNCTIVQPIVVGRGQPLPTDAANILDPEYCQDLPPLSFGRGLLSSLLILMCLRILSQVGVNRVLNS